MLDELFSVLEIEKKYDGKIVEEFRKEANKIDINAKAIEKMRAANNLYFKFFKKTIIEEKKNPLNYIKLLKANGLALDDVNELKIEDMKKEMINVKELISLTIQSNEENQDRSHRDFRAIDCFMKNVDKNSRFYTFAQEKAITDEEVYDLLLTASYSIGFINNFTGNAHTVNLMTQTREQELGYRKNDYKNRLADVDAMSSIEKRLACEIIGQNLDRHSVIAKTRKRILEHLLKKSARNKKIGSFSANDYIKKIRTEGNTVSAPINTNPAILALVKKCNEDSILSSEKIYRIVKNVKAGRARGNATKVNRQKTAVRDNKKQEAKVASASQEL